MGLIVDGKKIQYEKKGLLKNKIASFSDKLKLVVIQVGSDPAGMVYVKNK